MIYIASSSASGHSIQGNGSSSVAQLRKRVTLENHVNSELANQTRKIGSCLCR